MSLVAVSEAVLGLFVAVLGLLMAVPSLVAEHGSNPCLLHWQEDSSPRSHQGSPGKVI